jgi:sterol desaturase/sphingolipid hydroxylase (fatty acid hydroxylase superfamily)
MHWLVDTWEAVRDGLILPFLHLFDPKERLNWMYLLTSVLLAFYVYKKSTSHISFFKYLFHKKIWLSQSAFVDYKFLFFNSVLKLILIFPILYSWRYLGTEIGFFLEENGSLWENALNQNQVYLFYPIAFLILYDLTYYLIHLAMHKIPVLWEFHKIHHSATSLNPITQYRLHPVELLINNFNYVFVSSVLYGVFDYLCADTLLYTEILEVNVFTLLFGFFGATLRHSQVRLKYFNFLEGFLISPYQHQIHHSSDPKHFDKNMGSKLAIWDRLFGTLVRSGKAEKLKFGLGSDDQIRFRSFAQNLYMPFVSIPEKLFRRLSTIFKRDQA